MNALGQRIARLIRSQGPISVAEFMSVALHDRQSGYYARRDPLGADFTTAPEISQAFGELLGLWCAQVWTDQGRPASVQLVELGPGRGTMMRDALRALRVVPEFHSALEVVLVEASPVLAEKQREALGDCHLPLRWVTNAGAIDRGKPIFLLANEFFDALPAQQFIFTERGWQERVISADEGETLGFALAPAPTTLRVPPQRGSPEPGAVYEVSPSTLALVGNLATGIAQAGGAALFIDYGYGEAGFGETLQAVGRNHFADVLSEPGEMDVSAHVDFAALRDVALSAGCDVFGPIPQGRFLCTMGIAERAARLSRKSDEHTLAIERLIDPRQMGELFKVLAILPPGAPAPPGF